MAVHRPRRGRHSGGHALFELTIDQRALQAVTRALDAEDDGKSLRREMAAQLRDAVRPVIPEIQSGLMSIGHAGVPTMGEPLRETVSRGIRPETSLTGRSTGVKIRAKRTPGLRGFANAAKRLNRERGFRHPVFGMDVWVTQYGKGHWFEDPILARRDDFRKAIWQVLEKMARRVKHRVEH